MLLAHTDMDDRTLRDELLTLLAAGHETTATALAWALERLAHHPRAWERLQTAATRTTWTRSCKETLRLRPVVPAVLRLLKAPFESPATTSRPASPCVPNILLVHTREDVYPDPFAFRPERFLEQPAGHLHVDPVRRRRAPLPGRELRAVRDEGRAARGRRRSPSSRPREPRTPSARPAAPSRSCRSTDDGRDHRGATSSACAPRATGPVRSLRIVRRQPRAALGDLRLRVQHTHSPTGSRRKCTVSSVLMNR